MADDSEDPRGAARFVRSVPIHHVVGLAPERRFLHVARSGSRGR
jgi:hypothetical protein